MWPKKSDLFFPVLLFPSFLLNPHRFDASNLVTLSFTKQLSIPLSISTTNASQLENYLSSNTNFHRKTIHVSKTHKFIIFCVSHGQSPKPSSCHHKLTNGSNAKNLDTFPSTKLTPQYHSFLDFLLYKRKLARPKQLRSVGQRRSIKLSRTSSI